MLSQQDLTLVVRNILLIQLLTIFLVPRCALVARRELLRFWRSIHAPLLHGKEAPKKGSNFWKIDLTKLEP
jgi:hypothetical protein